MSAIERMRIRGLGCIDDVELSLGPPDARSLWPWLERVRAARGSSSSG